jgi:hypothetical protein
MTVIHSNLPHLPIKGRSDLCSGGTIYVTEVCGKTPPSIPPDCAAIVQDSIHNKEMILGPPSTITATCCQAPIFSVPGAVPESLSQDALC